MDSAARRRRLYDLLGELPDRDRPIGARRIAREDRDAYVLETLVLDLNGIEDVPAYLALPKRRDGPVAAVVYNHAHGGDYVLGKDEFLRGRAALADPPYADALARAGYAALCIDHWNFGERRGRRESWLFKEMLWRGQVLWGLMVYDTLRATDYLVSRPEVDPRRVASLGLSMGSTMAWWHAALDERVRVCVDLCCLTDFEELIATQALDEHGIYYYVPGLLRDFDTATINALIAPRAHLSINGRHDPLTPPRGLAKIDAALRRVYADAGRPEAWTLSIYETGHFETAAGRAEVMAYLERWL